MFYPWIFDDKLDIGQNCLSEGDFDSDAQTLNGFKAGEVISAIRVNSALRQANLIAVALTKSLGSKFNTYDIDLTSSVEAVTAAFTEAFDKKFPTNIVNAYLSGVKSYCIKWDASTSFIQGTASRSVLFATSSTCSHSYCFFAGLGHISSRDHQTAVGKWSDLSSDSILFAIGNGKNKDNRSNAFQVNLDGTASLGKEPVNDMDIAVKKTVTTLKSQLQSGEVTVQNCNQLQGYFPYYFRGFGTNFQYRPDYSNSLSLNDAHFKSEGYWLIANKALATAAPKDGAHGWLDVSYYDGHDFDFSSAQPIVKQTFTDWDTGETWVRCFRGPRGWTEWRYLG